MKNKGHRYFTSAKRQYAGNALKAGGDISPTVITRVAQHIAVHTSLRCGPPAIFNHSPPSSLQRGSFETDSPHCVQICRPHGLGNHRFFQPVYRWISFQSRLFCAKTQIKIKFRFLHASATQHVEILNASCSVAFELSIAPDEF